jgi:hypothetical protein
MGKIIDMSGVVGQTGCCFWAGKASELNKFLLLLLVQAGKQASRMVAGC